jgi:hypothetical protein
VNKINGKAYIGYTGQSIDARFNQHVKAALNGELWAFASAIRKYGIDAWEHQTLETHETKQEAIDAEIRLIAEHQTFIGDHRDKGYNMTRGGEGGKMLEEGYKRISEKLKGTVKTPEECCEIQDRMLKFWASDSPESIIRREQLVNRNRTDEARQRSTETQNQRWANPEAHQHMSKKLKGLQRNEESKELYSKTMTLLWQDPDYRIMMIKAFKNRKKWSIEARQQKSKRMTGEKRGPYKNRGIKRGPRQTKVVCKICGQTFIVIHSRHTAKHGLTREAYDKL